MDNVTHTLFAATLARVPPFARAGRGAIATLIIASNAPDADIVHALTDGSLRYLEVHRGATHGPLGAAALGIASAAIVRLAVPGTDLRRLMLLGIAGTFCHILMDLPTAYGTRLLTPFSQRWFALDWMPIIDVYLLLALVMALAAGWCWPARRTTTALAALALMCANYALRGTMLRVAASELSRPGRNVPGCHMPAVVTWDPIPAQSAIRPPVCGAALPTFTSPFAWRLIRFGDATVEIDEFNTVTRRSSPLGELSHATNPLMLGAAEGRVGQVFLRFARLPVARWKVSRYGGGVAEWTDLRFTGRPSMQQSDTRGPFTVSVRVDDRGGIVAEKIGGM